MVRMTVNDYVFGSLLLLLVAGAGLGLGCVLIRPAPPIVCTEGYSIRVPWGGDPFYTTLEEAKTMAGGLSVYKDKRCA